MDIEDVRPDKECEKPSLEKETAEKTSSDFDELIEEFPELNGISDISELPNSARYTALREIGLSPAEAYVLTSRRRAPQSTKSHLTASVPVSAKSPDVGMSSREMEEVRELFGDLSDSEIHKLYKKVTK